VPRQWLQWLALAGCQWVGRAATVCHFALSLGPGASNRSLVAHLLPGACCGWVGQLCTPLPPAPCAISSLLVLRSCRRFTHKLGTIAHARRQDYWGKQRVRGIAPLCGPAGGPSRDTLLLCRLVQMSAAARSSSSSAADEPRVWLRFRETGVPRPCTWSAGTTIGDLAVMAVATLGALRTTRSDELAAFKATAIAEDEDLTATIDPRPLRVIATLADLGISAEDHVVFKLRAPPAAATGGAGTSSGERRAAPWALAPASVRIALQQLYPCLPAHVAGTSGAASAAGGAAASSGERRAAPAMAQRLGFFAARASLLLLFCDASAGSAAAATGGAGTSSGEQRAVPCALTPSSVRTSLQQFACL